MLLSIDLSYKLPPLEVLQVTPLVSVSSPFEEQAPYEPLFATPKRNKEWLTKSLPKSIKTAHSDSGEELWYYENLKTHTFYYFTHNGKQATYVVRCQLVNIPFVGQAVCQTSLWRDKKYSSTLSIPSWVFFHQLLPKYKSILSDKSQSVEGREFWVRRIAEAIRQKLFVYVVDTRQPKVKLTRIKTVKDFDLTWAKKLWSSTNKGFQNVRILITAQKLQ